MDLGLKDKVAIVTASSTGIGKAVAEALISEGANVAICSRSKEKLIEASKDIKNKFGIEPFWCVCDINSQKDIENFYNAVVKQFGSVDILVNNCGGPIPGYFIDLTEDDWNDAFKQVLLSVIRFSHLVLPDMIKNEWGRIINITSVAVKQPVHNLILSNSFRAAVTGFAKTLSNEVANKNITVNNVAPGYTLTHRLYELAVNRARTSGKSHEEILVEMAKDVPMNRLGGPEEIAALVAFLASKQASYITGTTIQVDGGSTRGIF
ncbi:MULTISPECIES: SDR family oxidoreductase [Ignavibacterium]|jgi:3-oxoacyl-[acyl-carrier protein] reductase|uniref:SDR family oxidoreductase n=1 Tax=Ignavibacterium TaxID=795750 RepID=UPI0025B91656|nr:MULTISPECIES: SDR family oxidoreductase [Ignavibacterium]MBI5661932.1 SDR family oxidoreductase [Ignavibacterium album]